MINFAQEQPITLMDAAKKLSVTINTIRNWTKRLVGKRLETATLGGRIYTSLEAIQRFSNQDQQIDQSRISPETIKGLRRHGIEIGGNADAKETNQMQNMHQ